MPQIVALPNGEEAEFPDGMPEQEIEAILQKQFGAPKKNPADLFRQQLATTGSFGHTPQPEEMPEGAAGKLAMAGTIASLPLGVQAAGAPLAALRGLAMSAAGASAGGYAGTGLGRGLEMVGAPEGTSETAGTIGGLVGGVAGPVGGPMALAKLLKLGGGKAGMLGQIGERLAGTGAATQAAKTVAPEVARKAELDIAIKEARLAKIAADAERAKEIHAARLAKATAQKAPKAGPRAVPEPAPAPRTEGATALKPDAEFVPDDAVSLVAEPLPFKPRVKPATNLGGKAKPGPAATPPDKLEETLRASLDAIKEKKASKAALEAIAEKVEASPLQVPRIQVGAQRVGKSVGMTKEEVRKQAGPVLDEALGEASPILPIQPFQKIIDTMKAIPRSEREAYVARATSGKTKWQVENIRRTLEHLGLLLPVGVAAGMSEQ